MRLLPRGLGNSQSRLVLIFLLVLVIAARVSAQRAGDDRNSETTADAAQTTDDRSTSDSTPSVTESSAATTAETTSSSSSEKTTSSSSSSSSSTSSTKSEKTTSMDTTTTSSTSSETSSTTDSTTTSSSSSVSTTTTSTSSSSTTDAAPIVTVPPTANAPYMQTTNTPEGTVFIAVGAALGLIGLAVLAWRGMVAWSVNRSVRRAALAQSESKRLLRGSRKKRSAAYAPAPATDVSLEKLGAATRASYKPSKRAPSGSSGLFYSPTAGGAGSHHSLNASGNNRASTYLPAGFYTAAGGNNSTPRDSIGAGNNGYPPSSPSLPPANTYHDGPGSGPGPRHSYVGASTSSLNLSQAHQGRAPSAYLEDLFENHTPPPRRSDRR